MIALHSISKSFGDNHVLRDIDLRVNTGESLTIIGRSGTGKSVLIKCILGLVRPDAGHVTVNDQKMTPHSRTSFLNEFGMLFQGAALFDSLRVWENVAFRLLQQGADRSSARQIALEKLDRVGLAAETANLFPAELSGGMQKRAGLARAIALNPKVIFFDEPTTGLDPIMSGTINTLIRDIVAETGATTITITHDMTTVRAISDHVALLDQGQIAWLGPVDDIDTTRHPVVRQFAGGDRADPSTGPS